MLTIRNHQIAILNQDLRARFQERMVAHVAAEYPTRFSEWGGERTAEFVAAAIAKGATHGIHTEGAITVLIELLVEAGGSFDHVPDRKYVQNILNHPTLPGDAKVESIQRRIRSRTQGRVINVHRGEAT